MGFLLLLTFFLSACGGSNTLILYDSGVTPVVSVSSHMAPTTLGGGAAWIHNCQAGWQAYQAHPTYQDGKGEEKPRDVYLFGFNHPMEACGTTSSMGGLTRRNV